MLDILRANKGSLIAWVFLGAIIVVFVVSFGPGSFARGGGGCAGPGADSAAVVNGKTITTEDFQRQYAELLKVFERQTGQPLSRELADQLGLRAAALNQLVDRTLAVQEAKRLGIVASDQEISDTVRAIPAFQTGGAFDFDAYKRAVSAYYGSPARFEAQLRDDLVYQKVMATLRESVNVSPDAVRQAWLADADRVGLTFVRFPVAAAESAERPTDADAKAFAAADAARVEKYYADNAARYDQKKKVRARQILVRVPQGASTAQEEAAKKKIDEAAARVKKGEPFAKVASEVSEDPATKDRGGELGFVTEGIVDKAIADAAFSLAPGQVSQPVRTASGWHLLQVEEVVPAKKITLDEARLDIAKTLLAQDRAKALAGAEAAKALSAAKAGKPLADLFPAAGAKGKKPFTLGGQTISAEETGAFTAGSPAIPKLGAVPDLLQDALAANAGAVLPKVYDTPAGPVVAVVTTRERPDPKAFEAARAAVETRLENRKLSQVEAAWMKHLRDTGSVKVNEAAVTAAASRPQDE